MAGKKKTEAQGSLRITLVKSTIGRLPAHRKTVAALGLGKVGSMVEQPKNPAVLGMVQTVGYMLKVEEV